MSLLRLRTAFRNFERFEKTAIRPARIPTRIFRPANLNSVVTRRFVKPKVITVKTLLPLSVALGARKAIYPYPQPSPQQFRTRTIRLPLHRVINEPMVQARIRIANPRFLPTVAPGYVSLRGVRRGKTVKTPSPSLVGHLNIHSQKQLHRVMAKGEFNRRRYDENKSRSRHLRNGQLESMRSDAFGSVAEQFRRGNSMKMIADSALATRAIQQAWEW